MASTRNALEESSLNVTESMGVRRVERPAKLSPVSSSKDIGRMPLRTFGRVEIDRIVADPNQPRTDFDDADIRLFGENIRTHGQLHPIRVRWNDGLSKWVIVSGERRWRAAKVAGLATIDCYFVEGSLSEAELREQQLVENLLRKDLKPLEEARAYQSLMELNGWNGKQVAAALQVTTSRVSRALALLDLPDAVQLKIQTGSLSKSSAYEISKLHDPQTQTKLAHKAASGELPHAKTVEQISQRRHTKPSRASAGLHQVLFAENGMRITVSRKEKANYHEVEEALCDALDEVRLRIANNVKLF